jgi:hypothetical protein
MNKTEAQNHLLNILKPGQIVYTMLTHVSASKTKRCVRLFVASTGSSGQPDILDITYRAHLATGYPVSPKHGGVVVAACGTDAGFEAVYNLGACLWPNGTPAPHGTRNGEPDSTGGYALKQRWL